jgi:ferrous iron transport protein B
LTYDSLEPPLSAIEAQLKGDYRVSKRTIALLLLQGDPDVEKQVQEKEGASYDRIQELVAQARASHGHPLSYLITLKRQQEAQRIIEGVVTPARASRARFGEGLSRAMMHPITGALILLAVLYFGLYWFVGVFGAGILVGFIEGTIFREWINPWLASLVTSLIPWGIVQKLFIGDYGIINLGLTYTLAIILPILGTFFLAFSVIEDSGYLPRLDMLADRLLKVVGLSGRAVIPLVLGLGCRTMATIVTRTLETKRERLLTTLLLTLAIPCSAQLGIIFGILSANTGALLIWAGVVGLAFIGVGYLASKVIPGERPSFFMEVPPLRLPHPSNVLVKSWARTWLFVTEIMPIFMLASVLIWMADIVGLFGPIIGGLELMMAPLGLPREAAVVFLFGFFRREMAAARLHELHSAGALTGVPLLVAIVTLTFFIPCIAQVAILIKERGLRTALAITAFVIAFAFFAGFILNLALNGLGVKL